MREHCIDLTTLSRRGRAEAIQADEGVDIRTTHSITDYMLNLRGDANRGHCVSPKERYRLPFQIDMSVRLDYPMFILFIGGGHITFASPNENNRRIEDIVKSSGKPNQDHHLYDDNLPYGQFVDISVVYNVDEMQILIGGEERFYSRKQAYMKAKNLKTLNEEGFLIHLAVSKRSVLSIKSMTVVEYDDHVPLVHRVIEDHSGPQAEPNEQFKPTFENVLSGLPQEFRQEVIETNDLLTSLRPLKFKRMIDKGGSKITYVAPDFGVSYAFVVSGTQLTHHFGWYIVYNGKPETWHRKADYMEAILGKIAQEDPPLGERIFYALNDCIDCYGSRCLAKTPYSFGDRKCMSCHGRVVLCMSHEDFIDARAFFRYTNMLMEERMANGDPLLEKIFMIKGT